MRIRERARLSNRTESLCPQSNGTTIGSSQEFTLLCATDLVGTILNITDTPNMLTCIDACSASHPRCEGVTFRSQRCEMWTALAPGSVSHRPSPPNRIHDAALARFPQGVTSNCGSMGETASMGGIDFSVHCGQAISGADMMQMFASTFQECMSKCSGTPGCEAVTFDSTMRLGFKNCYLKGGSGTGSGVGVGIADGMDTAVVNGAAVPDPEPVGASPTTPATGASGANPTSSQGGIPQSSNGLSISIPTLTPIPLPTAISSDGTAVISTAAASSVPSTGLASEDPDAGATELVSSIPQPPPTPSIFTSGFSSTTIDPEATDALPSPDTTTGEGGPNNAWIAAPIAGSIVAVLLIAAIFLFWGRRRRAARRVMSSGESAPAIESGNRFTAAMASLGHRIQRLVTRSPSAVATVSESNTFGRRTFGNYWPRTPVLRLPDEEEQAGSYFGSKVAGGLGSEAGRDRARSLVREGRAGVRRLGDGSSFGVPIASSPGPLSPHFEIRGNRMTLRPEMNGLTQHHNTLDGIPDFLRR